MIKKHHYDVTGRAFELGKNAEDGFVTLMSSKGWQVEPSTTQQNMIEHFDYIIAKDDRVLKIEVKAEKRISSRDENTQSEWVWIEFQAVNGSPGWLYGNADYIAFQRDGVFHFANREKLVEVAEKLTKMEYVSRSVDAKYRYYRRFKRNDLLTLIQFSDIIGICEEL
jgi:hypothetical protein